MFKRKDSERGMLRSRWCIAERGECGPLRHGRMRGVYPMDDGRQARSPVRRLQKGMERMERKALCRAFRYRRQGQQGHG